MSRILHIGKYFPPFSGGIENFMASLLPAQAARDIDVSVLVHEHEKGGTRAREPKGVEIRRVPTLGTLVFTPLSPRFPSYLKQEVRRFEPDILHVHAPNVSAFWTLFSRSCRGIPIVVHWHADVVPSRHHLGLWFAYWFYRPFEQALLRRASAIIASSPAYLASSKPLKRWRDKCHVIPLGLADTPRGDPEKTAVRSLEYWGSEPSRMRILSVGRLTYYKGYEFLIQAVAEVADVHAIIVGTGDRQASLKRLIEGGPADGKAALYGHATDGELRELMDSCDCLCLPSIERTEAFGLVLLEAMRAGKPVIAMDVEGSGMSWVVRHGETGLIARAGDVDSLREAIVTLRDDEDTRLAMGRAGRERFLEHFTIERVAEQTNLVYKECLEGKGQA